MKKQIAYCIVLILPALLAVSCNLFETRSPEEPTGRRSSFVPPVEPELVLQNLSNSIVELNPDDYAKSFIDTSFSKRAYKFTPSATALAVFASSFATWTVESESRYFNSVVTKSIKDVAPVVTFSNAQFQQAASDQSTCTADYSIQLWHSIAGVPKLYRGSLRLTLMKNSSSLWAISEWLDIQTSDTTSVSWSYMKALF